MCVYINIFLHLRYGTPQLVLLQAMYMIAADTDAPKFTGFTWYTVWNAMKPFS